MLELFKNLELGKVVVFKVKSVYVSDNGKVLARVEQYVEYPNGKSSKKIVTLPYSQVQDLL